MDYPSESKEYKIAAYKIYLLAWMLFVGIYTWQLIRLISLTSSYLLLVISLPIMVYFLPYTFYVFHKERLVLSKDGIQHKTLFFTMFVSWDKIIRVDHFRFGFKRLVVEKTKLEKTKNKWIQWTQPVKTLGDTRESIPLGVINWARYKDLENELKKRVPHLEI
jgi:hypothetical protein